MWWPPALPVAHNGVALRAGQVCDDGGGVGGGGGGGGPSRRGPRLPRLPCVGTVFSTRPRSGWTLDALPAVSPRGGSAAAGERRGCRLGRCSGGACGVC